MLGYVIRRLLLAIPTILGATTISFLLMRVVPGDPARMVAGPDADKADIDRIRENLGLDESILNQYLTFLGNLAHGDLGRSSKTSQPVIEEIANRAVFTVQLAVFALLLAIVVGCACGVLAALRRGTLWDTAISGISVVGVSMPTYWSGLLLVLVFGVQLRWLPVAGAETWQSSILPVVTLAFFAVGFIARQTRSAMIETMEFDFIRSVRAKGVNERLVVLKHGLRNAALPIVTIIGIQFGTMLSGAVLTETVFAWPGLGRLMVDSLTYRDYAVVQGVILVLAAAVILVNIVTDVVYAYIDPRIRYD